MSNESHNKKELSKYINKLKKLGKDMEDLPEVVLTDVSNMGVAYAKRKSPVITGKFRNAWYKEKVQKTAKGVQCKIGNTMEYASYVNYGHRTVDGSGKTTGYVVSKKGDHLLERTLKHVNRKIEIRFEKMIKEIKAKNDA